MNRNFRLFSALLLVAGFVFSGLIFSSRNPVVASTAETGKRAARGQTREIKFTPGELWGESERTPDRARANAEIPEKSRLVRLDRAALADALRRVPPEFAGEKTASVILPLPLPDGSFENFRVEESSVLEPDLAAAHPQIKSYRGQSVDRPARTTRFDLTTQGFHAFILDGGKMINVIPAGADDAAIYAAFDGEEIKGDAHYCAVDHPHEITPPDFRANAPQAAVGGTVRNYRISIAATFEYANTFGGGTNAGTVASINTWLNGTNAIYERDLAVHLNLVNDVDVLYTAERGFTATTDPYDNANAGTMLGQVRPDLRDKVGQANYDLGHVLGTTGGTGGSGVAFIGVVCRNSDNGGDGLGPLKGGGATRVGGAVGNSTALGVLVHEFGHQFGANHNFNGTLANCAQRNSANSYETGSGSTIMGYSGICGADNIATVSDLRFHAMSYAAITSYINNFGTCFTGAATGNTPPVVSGGGNRTIPRNTPFTLTATASDANGDSLTYNWEQIDAGGTNYPQNGTEASYTDAADPTATTRPIFRAFASTPSPSRTFPSLTYILNNANDPPLNTGSGLKTAEELPRVGRALNFRVTARDNRAGGGGVNEDTVALTVDGSSGPFLVTAPNTDVTLYTDSTTVVTWSVNNTDAAPVGAANVRILFSSDGGNTFPTILLASTANDGSELVSLPSAATTTARIKVEAVGNIFFDISDTNFTLAVGPTSASVSVGGRVADAAGRGVRGARIALTDSGGITRYALTNAFGYYRFDGLAAGETYIFDARHKRYRFSTQIVNVTGGIAGLDFVALP